MNKCFLPLVLLFFATQAGAAELRVITSGAMQGVLRPMAAEFGAANGHRIEVVSRGVAGVREMVEAGEPADVIMTSDLVMDAFLASGVLKEASLTRIGFIGIGLAVREDAPQPNISSGAEFREAMLAAGSIVYQNPDRGISSAVALKRIFEELGISDDIVDKSLILDGGLAALRVANGDAEIALQNMTQLVGVEGIAIVGPLPHDIQIQTGYAAGVAASSKQQDIAAALIAYLTRQEAQRLWVESGFEPVTP
jgi:molybdate transport system substrate-binding protein